MTLRENSTLEYKVSVTNSFLKTVSAFANFGGGRVIFGVDDGGAAAGLENPKAECLNIENRINDGIHPVPPYTLEIDRTNNTVILTVRMGADKPYLYKGKAYKRNDSATIEVSRLELNRLVLDGMNQNFEDLASPKQDLTFQLLEFRMRETLGIGGLTRDIMKTLGLYSDESGYNRAAELLADKNSFAGLDIVRFGRDADEIKDRKTCGGVSVLALFDLATEMFQKYYRYEKVDGVRRSIIDMVPEKAFREAIANGIAHRTWDVNAAIRVSMFRDRVEIASPGGLPPGLSRDEYLNSQISLLRNPRLANVLFRLRYIEKFGTGILRIRNAYAGAEIKPVFSIYAESVCVSLPVADGENRLDTDERKIIAALSGGRVLTRAEISDVTGCDKSKALRVILRLLDKNAIEKTGTGRGTKYRLP